jgi:hypothetical protein
MDTGGAPCRRESGAGQDIIGAGARIGKGGFARRERASVCARRGASAARESKRRAETFNSARKKCRENPVTALAYSCAGCFMLCVTLLFACDFTQQTRKEVRTHGEEEEIEQQEEHAEEVESQEVHGEEEVDAEAQVDPQEVHAEAQVHAEEIHAEAQVDRQEVHAQTQVDRQEVDPQAQVDSQEVLAEEDLAEEKLPQKELAEEELREEVFRPQEKVAKEDSQEVTAFPLSTLSGDRRREAPVGKRPKAAGIQPRRYSPRLFAHLSGWQRGL